MEHAGEVLSATATGETLPVLAIVYGSLSMEQPLALLAGAAEGVCRPLWVLPFDHKESRSAIRLLRAQGELSGDVVDVSKMSMPEAAEAVRAYDPDGITCFIDETIMWTAEFAELIGLPFHSRQTATQLTDKFEQRAALRDHGLRTPPFWRAEDLADDEAVREVVETAGLPLVLKPRRGTAGQDAEQLRTADALRDAAASVAPERMLVEGYIPDPTTPLTGSGSAPFASVELAVSGTAMSVLGVTGRTPLAEPFRETGQLFPADVDPTTRAGLIEAAEAAATALGIKSGILHIEVKPTDDGPVVIEVNGRPGGYLIREFVQRATGVDLVEAAMRLALGDQVIPTVPNESSEVGFLFLVQPDLSLRHITSVEGLDEVRNIPGVERVVPGIAPGSDFSWRAGSLSFAAQVSGTAPDHATVRQIRDQVLATVVVSGDENGHPLDG